MLGISSKSLYILQVPHHLQPNSLARTYESSHLRRVHANAQDNAAVVTVDRGDDVCVRAALMVPPTQDNQTDASPRHETPSILV